MRSSAPQGFRSTWAIRYSSLQSPAQRLRRLPGLLIADVGIAHRGADVLVSEQLLDFPKVGGKVQRKVGDVKKVFGQ